MATPATSPPFSGSPPVAIGAFRPISDTVEVNESATTTWPSSTANCKGPTNDDDSVFTTRRLSLRCAGDAAPAGTAATVHAAAVRAATAAHRGNHVFMRGSSLMSPMTQVGSAVYK